MHGDPKASAPYRTELAIDLDDDGEIDLRANVYLYDLRLEHRNSDARIAVITYPVSSRRKDKRLEIEVRRIVGELSGSEFVRVMGNAGEVGMRGRRTTSLLLDEQSVEVAGRAAWAATVDVADVDRLTMDPSVRDLRMRIVVVQTGLQQEFGPSHGSVAFPVRMLIVYQNDPESFEDHLADFERFLSSIRIADGPPSYRVQGERIVHRTAPGLRTALKRPGFGGTAPSEEATDEAAADGSSGTDEPLADAAE